MNEAKDLKLTTSISACTELRLESSKRKDRHKVQTPTAQSKSPSRCIAVLSIISYLKEQQQPYAYSLLHVKCIQWR